MTAAESLLLLTNPPPDVSANAEVHTQTTPGDFGWQVSSGDFVSTFDSFIDTEKKLKTVAGLPSLALLNALIILLTKVSPESNQQSMNNKD